MAFYLCSNFNFYFPPLFALVVDNGVAFSLRSCVINNLWCFYAELFEVGTIPIVSCVFPGYSLCLSSLLVFLGTLPRVGFPAGNVSMCGFSLPIQAVFGVSLVLLLSNRYFSFIQSLVVSQFFITFH